jgi:hypothetical protein
MASGSKRRQTMAKMNRERAVREKRALKREKKEARKQAAADAQNGSSADLGASTELPEGPITSEEVSSARLG